MPQHADGFQQNSGFTLDGTMYDGSTSTGYEVTGPLNGLIEVTGLLDLGASPTAVKKIQTRTKYANSPTAVLEYSDDLSTWASPSGTWNLYSPHLNSYTLETVYYTLTTAASHRYWRTSWRDNSNGTGTPRIGMMELWAEDAGGTLIPEPGPIGRLSTLMPILLLITPALLSAVVNRAATLTPAILKLTPALLSASTASGTKTAVIIPAKLGMRAATLQASNGGDLILGMDRDCAGALWQPEAQINAQAVGAGAIPYGNGFGVLYGVMETNDVQVYWITCPNPEDWTGRTGTAVTGLKGIVRALAWNRMRVQAALIGAKVALSRDQWQTWEWGGAVGGLDDKGIAGIHGVGDLFVIVQPRGAGILRHWISFDGGATWN